MGIFFGIVVRFDRHGVGAGGLDGWDAAADVRRRELRLGYLAWLVFLLRNGRFELEQVGTLPYWRLTLTCWWCVC